MFKHLISIIFISIIYQNGFSQYQINGSASQTSCNCYQLTPNSAGQAGSVWNTNLIDLTQSFDFNFQIMLGCSNGGADGICFGLQPNGTAVGTAGGGMGFQNITPSVGIFIDTYQNGAHGDPAGDHISINLNGDIDHNTANNVSGPLDLGDLEDCAYHDLQITWDATTTTYSVFLDGSLVASYINDIVNSVFGGNPMVYWGFTGATGALFNDQGFCTQLIPGFIDISTGGGCAGDPINFSDTSSSFGSIQSWQWDFGDGNTANIQNPQNTYTSNGSYPVTLTITDDAGCSATTTSNVFIGTPGITATATPNPACYGEQVQLGVEIDASGSTCNYSLEMFDSFGDGWNGNYIEVFENGASIGQLGDGPLGSGFNNGNGPQTDGFTVTDGATLDFVWNDGAFIDECSYNIYDANGTQIFIADYAAGGPGNGTTVFSTTGSCPNAATYFYQWEPNGLVSNATISDPTTILTSTQIFTITADNGGGCSSVDEITITITQPNVDITATPTTVCAGQQVQLNASVTPGTPPPAICDYSLEMFDSFGDGWNGAYVEVFEDGISVGQLGDGPSGSGFNNGSGPQTDAVSVYGGSVLTFTWNTGVFDTECSFNLFDWQGNNIYNEDYGVSAVPGNGVTIFTTTATCPGGIVTPTYSWTTTPYISDPNIQSPTTIITATTVYSVTADDGTGCMGTNQVTITLLTPPQIVTTSNPTCNFPPEGVATVNVLNGSSPFTYQWDINTGSQTTQSATGLAGGLYTVTITESSGCFVITTTSVTAAPGVTITPSQNNATCNEICDGQAWFTASGGTTPYIYLWSDGSSNAFKANLCAGEYSVTTTDNIGCESSLTYTITEPPATILTNYTTTNSNCNLSDGIATILNVSGGISAYTYLWDNGETGTTATALSPGNHSISITLISGNCLSVFDISISNTPGPNVSTTYIPATCNGFNDGEATAIPLSNGGSNSFTFYWSGSAQTSASISGLSAGQYAVTLIDANTCEAQTNFTITEPSVVTVEANANFSTVCIDQCTNIEAFAEGGNGAPYTYLWSDGTVGQSTNACPTTASFFYVTATDVLGCESEISIPAYINLYPEISLLTSDDMIICEDDFGELWVFSWGGNGGPYSYSWSNGTNGTNTNVTPNSYPLPSNYQVTVSDGCSPSVSATIEISYYPTPEPRFNSDELSGCEPFTTTIYPISSTVQNMTTCLWTLGDGTTFSNNCSSFTHEFYSAGSYDVTLSSISADGCAGSFTWYNMINVHELPIAYFKSTPNPTTTLNTQIDFKDLSAGVIQEWDWTFYYLDSVNVLTQSSEQHPTIEYPAEAGTYPVNLEVETLYGCSDDTTFNVKITESLEIYLPNAFSPNGDGLNETFGPTGTGIDTADFTFMIFDRWGHLLFETNDINVPWNGYNQVKGGSEKVPVGAYVWVLDIKGNTNTNYQEQISRRLNGHVTLVR